MIRPEIGLSDTFLDLSVETGNVLDGSFTIYSKNGQELTGKVLSSHHKLVTDVEELSGTECRISYHFKGETAAAGEEYFGEFLLLTNGGEFNIPYCVAVTPKKYRYGEKTICDLKEFYEYAKSDWKQARDMFFTKDFPEIMLAEYEEYRILYHELLKGFSKDAILEQFLIETMGKKPVSLSVNKDAIPVDVTKVGRIILKKDGWGCLEGRLSSAAGNLYLSREKFTQNDFEEGKLEIFVSFKEKAEKDHFIIETAFSRICVPVYKEIKNPEGENDKTKKNRDMAGVLRHLVDFRTGKIEEEEFVTRSMNQLPTKGLFYELYCLLLLIIRVNVTGNGQEECNEYAKKIEEKEAEYLLDIGCGSFYYYVMSLWKRDNAYAGAAAREVRKTYESDKRMRDYLILISLDESIAFDCEAQWEELVRFIEQGENSPMLYLAVLDVLNQEPYLLEQLHDYKAPVIQWGLRHKYLSRKLIDHFARLAIREKCFKKNQLSILQNIYEKKQDELYLKAICSVLMKGNKKETEYHCYFEDALRKHLNLVGLNEFYLRSLDFDTYPVLPKLILYYFHYSNSLDRREKAWLYLNILKNQEAYDEIYETYKERIEDFVKEQLIEGRINRQLRPLYEFMLPDLLSETELAKYVPNLIFKKRLVCENPMMEGVYVYHPENEEEVHVSFVEGICQIEIYSSKAKIYFVDRMGNRYRSGIEYSLQPYLEEETFRSFCLEHARDDRRVYVKWLMGLESVEEEQAEQILVDYTDEDQWIFKEEKDVVLLQKAYSHFVYGTYHRDMLLYLRTYMESRVFDLLELWNVLKKEAMLTAEFEKRVLDQIAFVGSKDERMLDVLKSYLLKEEDNELAERMLLQYSDSYLLNGLNKNQNVKVRIPEQYFGVLEQQAEKDHLHHIKNRLSYLLYKANAGYREKEQQIIRNMIREFCQKEIVFPYFQRFEKLVSIPSLWKESVFFWFTAEEKQEYVLNVVSGFGEECRKMTVAMREIASGFYYGVSYIPCFERILQMSASDYDGNISVAKMNEYLPGSRSHLLFKMTEEKNMAASWMTDYEKIMERMKEQLKFLSDR